MQIEKFPLGNLNQVYLDKYLKQLRLNIDLRVNEGIRLIPEYYDELFELFSSIKNGTFKGVKRFQGANYARTSEVKGKLMRVVFDRIGKNSYAIITAFAKKFDTSTAYRTSLESAIQSYIPMRETIMEKLSDDEFLNMHKELELDLMRRLSPAKQPQYIKAKEASHA